MNTESLPPTTAVAPYLKTQIRLFLGGEIAMGPGKAELLAAIAETGSISAAGRKLDMSYRRAWLLVETMNHCFREPLVVSAKGGRHGGGAQLTDLGRQVLAIYLDMKAAVERQVAAYQVSLVDLLRVAPLSQDSSQSFQNEAATASSPGP